MLELRDLRCERDERCLFSGLQLALGAGDIVQIEGPNGSGKTTLLRILTTVSADFSGEILWQGQPLRSVRHDYLSQLLFIGHLPGVKKSLTPRENLSWYAGISRLLPRCPVDEALAAVGLYGYEDLACHALSAGQLRRVALARLYLSPARVWILDEPFTAIDKQGVSNLEALMQRHVAGGGCIVLTTHQDLGVAGVRRLNLLDFRPSAPGGEVFPDEVSDASL